MVRLTRTADEERSIRMTQSGDGTTPDPIAIASDVKSTQARSWHHDLGNRNPGVHCEQLAIAGFGDGTAPSGGTYPRALCPTDPSLRQGIRTRWNFAARVCGADRSTRNPAALYRSGIWLKTSNMLAVSNTSPISNLASIGRLQLLKEQFSAVWIPDSVFAELSAHPDPAAQTAIKTAIREQ